MAHVRSVQRKTGQAFEVHWRDSGKDRQRTFTVKRDAERFAARGDGRGVGRHGHRPAPQK